MKYINCPYCGAEYHPAEIFIPDYLIGKPNHIEKNSSGTILFTDGIEQDLNEKYICNYCKSPFNVSAKLEFVIKGGPKLSDKTKIPLRKYSMVMNEE